MDQSTRAQLIARYRDGYDGVMAALDGISPAGLEAREGPDEWCPREIAHHLADSETIGGIRLRQLIAEDDPVIAAYDQEAYVRRLYSDRPIEPSLAAFRAARETTADLLDRMTGDEWSRQGTHTEAGPFTVTDWLETYAEHAHIHADQIRRARAAARA
jgi:hypothetical protein